MTIHFTGKQYDFLANLLGSAKDLDDFEFLLFRHCGREDSGYNDEAFMQLIDNYCELHNRPRRYWAKRTKKKG